MRVELVVFVVACSGNSSPTPPDMGSPPDVDGLDLLVSPTNVVAYVGFTGEWAAHNPRFARPGECAEGESDAISIGTSCLERLEIDGVQLTGNAYGPANPYYGSPITGDATLRVVACGTSIEVPLDPGTYPVISDVQTMQSGDDLVVNWVAPEAASVLVGVAGGYGLSNCHETTATQHVFLGSGGFQLGVQLQAFRAPDVTETAIGQVRVWYGDIARRSSVPGLRIQ